MMRFKRICALLLALTTLLLLAACSTKIRSDNEKSFRNPTAAIVGDHEISAVEVNYFYIDAINTFYNNYSSYISYILSTTTPLNEQFFNETSGQTWADYFVEEAYSNIKATYAIYDEAMANGFTLSDDDKASLEDAINYMELYASIYGFSSVDKYLQDLYGTGASEDSYRAYYEKCLIADGYYSLFSSDLSASYTDGDLDAYQQGQEHTYNSYSFDAYYLAVSRFYPADAGTKGEDGRVTYSDEETAAAVEAAREAAEKLTNGKYATREEFNKAINELGLYLDSLKQSTEDQAEAGKLKYSATSYADILYSNINALYRDWVSGYSEEAGGEPTIETRQEGDLTYVESSSGWGINGFYIVRYTSCTDNEIAMKNVRHILIKFVKLGEDGKPITSTDSSSTTYTDMEKEYAYEQAAALLKQWKNGEATEDRFAELANENSEDTGSNTNGGLYENIYPGQMVEAFEDWCFDESRVAGDTGIVETEYGYHIMYFVGDTEQTYRNYMVTEAKRTEDVNNWLTALVEAIYFEVKTDKYINKEMTIG